MYIFVGCRTTRERDARGKGLEIFHIDARGAWCHGQTVPDLGYPSYLALGRTRDVLYVVHGDFSDVSALRIDPHDGGQTHLNRQSTEGRNPVHLVAEESGRFLIVANYATGTVALLPIEADGAIGPVCDLLQLPGSPGPHRTEQKASHPHQVLVDPQGRCFLLPDKGLDKVFVLAIDTGASKLVLDDGLSAVAQQGAGPRHGVFHPAAPYLYVANELDSTVTTWGYAGATAR
jgi:6-phosphogluconolactonase (cycloisomerase 2 family)